MQGWCHSAGAEEALEEEYSLQTGGLYAPELSTKE
jgi:hypothetical protein